MTAPTGPARRSGGLPRAWPLLLGGVLALVVIGVVARHQNPSPTAAPTAPEPSATRSSASSAGAMTSRSAWPSTTELPSRLATGGKGWQVLARTSSDVWAIDPSTGRVVHTPIPTLQSSGPVSFVAGPGWVMVRPLDYVAGYLIRDGSAPTALSGVLTGGPVLPGPEPETVWVESAGALDLVDLQGRRTGTAMLFGPPDPTGWPIGDGRGGALLPVDAGYRDLYPGSGRTIASLVIAAGPTGVLTAACPEHGQRCPGAVIGPTGRTTATPADWPASWSVQAPGVIAPDGSTAVVVAADQQNPGAGPRLWLIDLRNGALSAVGVRPPADIGSDLTGIAAFTPDGRHLVALDDVGAIRVIDVATGAATVLDRALPPVQQLAFRDEG